MISIGRKGTQVYSVEEEEIFPHVIVLGKTGCGKSSLVAKISSSLRGRKVIIDPHGDLCWRSGLPVYFPGEVYLNPLEGGEKILPDLIYTLKNSFGKEFWGPRTEHLLTCLISALKDKNPNFADLYFLLSNFDLFQEFLSKKRGISNLKSMRDEGLLSLLNKISPFVLRAPLREFLCRRSTKIPSGSFCLNSDVGIYGRENSKLMCSFFFSHLIQRELERRRRVWILCDEFHMYFCPSFKEALGEGRKYGISLILISSQIPKDLEECAFSNATALLVFKCGQDLAKRICKYWEVEEKEILTLKPREFLLLYPEGKVKLKTLYVPKGRGREPMPERLLEEDVIPIAVLSEVKRPELWKRILGLYGPFLHELLSTFP